MSVENLIENLKEIRVDALDMLKTIEAVKGKEFALMVHSMLMAHQIADIQHLLLSIAITNPDHAKLNAVRESMMMCVSQLLSNVGRAAGIEGEQLHEVIAQADAMTDKFQGLIQQAVKAEQQGTAFGGRDAA